MTQAKQQTLADVATPGRLDQFWTERLASQGVTRSKIQEWIKAGLALVDGEASLKPSHKLRGGERLRLVMPQAVSEALPEDQDLTVVYQDEHLLVLDKPAGLTVHPAPSCPEGTLVNRLVHHFPQLTQIAGQRPGIVHRLDKDTSGLLVAALSEAVRLKLSEAFAERQVEKTYLALVHGRPARETGTIDAPIGRDPDHKTRMAVVKGARQATSTYAVVWTDPAGLASLVEVSIGTGRTHQIRVHMTHLGHPLLGDALYGPNHRAALRRNHPLLASLASRQMLHAWRLSFTHPVTGEAMAFTRGVPRDFWRLVLALSRNVQRVGVVGLPGSGKSAVLGLLAGRGLAVWSADEAVRALYQPGQDGWHLLRGRFGDRFVGGEGRPVDKKALLAAMRASDGFRRELMGLLYPLVGNRLEDFWRSHVRDRAAFAEVPMLLEAGWLGLKSVDLAVGVRCADPVRHERLAARGWSQEDMALVDSWQWDQEKKMAACGLTVDNSGTLDELAGNLDAMLARLRQMRVAGVRSLLAWLGQRGYMG